jgi:hypothetical protein
VHHWANRCKVGEPEKSDLCDKQRIGRPVTATDEFHKEQVDDLVKENWLITQRQNAVKIGISQERVYHIIAILEYRNICARWFLTCLQLR